jgi:hypothetical protein
MKSETEVKLNRYESLDHKTHITNENLPVEKTELRPVEGEVDIEGVLKDADGGFRVKWTKGNYSAVIEQKVNGEWKSVGGVQKLTIEFDVNKVLPVVKIERFVV